jgi:hypothetical protein
MITEKIFKNIILTQVALIVAYFCLAIAEGLISPIDEDLSLNWLDSIILVLSFGYILSIILLYKFKPFGKTLFVSTFVLSIVLILFEGEDFFIINYSSLTPFISVVEELLGVVDGIILATLYFTSIKGKF